MRVNELLKDNPLVIVDVGASGGIDARWTRFSDCHLGILFEPDPREFEQLKLRGSKRLSVLNAALSDSSATVDFHLCRKQQTSSVFMPNLPFLAQFPELERFDITRVVQMRTDTLDNQLRQHRIDDIDFIKMDTQGCELPILKGATASLGRTVGMQLEVAFAPMYRDQPMFVDVDAYVKERGFELFDLKTHYWRRKDSVSGKGQLIFADAVYFRPPEQLYSLPHMDTRKMLRALCVYLAYGRSDVARVLARLAATGGALSSIEAARAGALIASFERRARWREEWRLRRLRRGIAKIAGRLRSR